MFSTFKLLLVYLTFGPVAGLLGIPYTLLVGDISLLYRVAMWIVSTGLSAGGIDVQVHGTELIPQGRSCIFMSNHVSNLDPPVLFSPGVATVRMLAPIEPGDYGTREQLLNAVRDAIASALPEEMKPLVP
jgi:hypothetical protein